MPLPVLKRSKHTLRCYAPGCSDPIAVHVIYISVLSLIKKYHDDGSFARNQVTAEGHHVRCFLAENTEVKLEDLQGFAKFGNQAKRENPPRNLWEHLTGED